MVCFENDAASAAATARIRTAATATRDHEDIHLARARHRERPVVREREEVVFANLRQHGRIRDIRNFDVAAEHTARTCDHHGSAHPCFLHRSSSWYSPDAPGGMTKHNTSSLERFAHSEMFVHPLFF
ncbi:MAG: hypothetical protein ACOX5G_07900 [Kiritimatiellia bacterium]